MIEKPLCNDLDEAFALQQAVEASGCAVALTHTFSGYAMLREMRARILAGEIGAVRLVHSEYLAGGLATAMENAPDADKRWRLNPEKSGPSLCSATSAPTPTTWCRSSPACGSNRCPPKSAPCWRDERCRISPRSASGSTAAPAAESILQRRGRDVEPCDDPGGRRNRPDGMAASQAQPADHCLARRQYSHHRPGQPNLTSDAQLSTHLTRPGHPEGLQEAVANLYCGLADRMLTRRGLAFRCRQLVPRYRKALPGWPL